jgi:hypothetical protein
MKGMTDGCVAVVVPEVLKENGVVVVLNEESVGIDVCVVVAPKLNALVTDGNDSDEAPNENCDDISSNTLSIQRFLTNLNYYFNELINIKKISIFFDPNKNSLSIALKVFFIQFYDVFVETINNLKFLAQYSYALYNFYLNFVHFLLNK